MNDLSLAPWFGLVYFGTKYLIAAVGIWLGIHAMMAWTREKSDPYMPYGASLLNRHPILFTGMCLVLDGIMFYAMNNLKSPYQESYYDALLMAEPFLYTWTALYLIVACSAISVYLYNQRNTKTAGQFSFAAVMLTALVAPYYYYAMLS